MTRPAIIRPNSDKCPGLDVTKTQQDIYVKNSMKLGNGEKSGSILRIEYNLKRKLVIRRRSNRCVLENTEKFHDFHKNSGNLFANIDH